MLRLDGHAVDEPPVGRRRPYPVVDLRAFLDGAWHLRRRGWLDGPIGAMRLRGRAEVRPCPRGLSFEETGTMLLGDYRGEAIRRYEFGFRSRSAADVFFDDGRFFYHVDLATGHAAIEHECGADLYRGSYHVLGPDRWIQRWTITGPRKRHRLTSLFTRIDGA